jgi:glucose 1-dehydrogenase
MKAVAVWPARREISVVDHPQPELDSPTAARVRVLEVGVCGTDAEICSFHFGTPPRGSEYLIVGHEALGVVEEVGSGVSRFRPGDLVVPSVRRPCPDLDCAACRSGNQDFCLTGTFTERGLTGAHGFLCEQIVEDERYLYPVPPELRQVGVLTEPLTIAEKGLRQYAAVQRRLPWKRDSEDAELFEGVNAVVLGAGPIGLLGCMALLARGCTVWIFSREPAGSGRATLAESLGATYASSSDGSFAELAGQIGRVDLVYEAAGSSRLAFDVLPHVARNGATILVGAPADQGTIPLRGDALLNRIVVSNHAIIGTVNAHESDFRAAIRDLRHFRERWPEALASLITGSYPMEHFCRCAREDEGIKRIILVDRAGPSPAG